jgi:hypothetical protein
MVMDHADALERIEIAAAEPGGLERLTAGDTPGAALVAGHLAACRACTDELQRISRTAVMARAAIRALPDPALRERTLAFVREVGRDRTTAPGATALGVPVSTTSAGAQAPVPVTAPAVVAPLPHARRPWLVAGLVAAVLVAAVLGFVAGNAVPLRGPGTGGDGAAVAQAAGTTMRIATQPDSVSVALAPVNGGEAAGSVLYSPASGELAMVATGLAPAPAGSTYACWVESGGTRRRIGMMYEEGGTGTWAGGVDGLAALPPGATFGVSLVTDGDTGTPVLQGS